MATFSFLFPLARARAPSLLRSLLFQKSDLLLTGRIKRGAGAYVVKREFHRRRWFTNRARYESPAGAHFGRVSINEPGSQQEITVNSRRSVDSTEDSEGLAEQAERKPARTSEMIPVPALTVVAAAHYHVGPNNFGEKGYATHLIR